MRYTVIVCGETVEVVFERTGTRIDATVGDRAYSLDASTIKPGAYWLNWNLHSIEITVVPAGESYSVSIGGHHLPVEILDGRKLLKKTAQHSIKDVGSSEIRASMPGKIVRILAPEGTDVERHQGIVVMEAMKMQNEIKSTTGGKILKLAVVEGETVRSGDLIAIVDAKG